VDKKKRVVSGLGHLLKSESDDKISDITALADSKEPEKRKSR